jgi:hypothetical protein
MYTKLFEALKKSFLRLSADDSTKCFLKDSEAFMAISCSCVFAKAMYNPKLSGYQKCRI